MQGRRVVARPCFCVSTRGRSARGGSRLPRITRLGGEEVNNTQRHQLVTAIVCYQTTQLCRLKPSFFFFLCVGTASRSLLR